MNFLNKLNSNKHFRFGVPFFLFIFGGQYALREFREVRYDNKINPKARKLITDEEAFEGFNKSDQLVYKKNIKTAEEELEALDAKIDWDNWENKRGPRPWEGTVEARPIKRNN